MQNLRVRLYYKIFYHYLNEKNDPLGNKIGNTNNNLKYVKYLAQFC